jgi:hypothetical protein
MVFRRAGCLGLHALDEAVDLEFEQPAGEMYGTRDVSALKLGGLADIDEQCPGIDALLRLHDAAFPDRRLDAADEFGG